MIVNVKDNDHAWWARCAGAEEPPWRRGKAGRMQTRKPLTAAMLLLGLLALPAAPLQAATDAVSSHLAAGSADARAGRYSSAEAEIKAALELDANNAEAWYQMGLLNGQMGEYGGAEQSFRRAIELDPQSAKAHCRLGQTLVADPQGKQDWPGAVAEFQAAVRLDARYPEAESLLGLGLMHLDQTEAAITTLQRAIQLDPAQAAPHLNMALVLEQQSGRLNEAAEQYRAALAAKPDMPKTQVALAELLARLGQPEKSEQAFRSALRLDPDQADAYFGLARTLRSEKRSGEAALYLQEAARMEQRKPEAAQAVELSNEGLQMASRGDPAGAIRVLRQAIALRPDYGVARYNLGLILADAGDLAAARGALIKAVSLLPARARLWFDLGRVLALMGDQEGAVQAVSWAVRLSPADQRFAAELSTLRSHAPPAAAHADPVADGREGGEPRFGALSDTVDAHRAFAGELRRQGDLEGAVGELLRALALDPGSSKARLDLAADYGSLSRWDRAAEEYRKVLLVVGQEDAGVHLALGNALLAGGHAPEAVDEFRFALKLKPHAEAAQAGLAKALKASHRQ